MSTAELVRRLREELHHAADNGHVLDRDCQGVAPGQLVPAVRASSVELLLELAERELQAEEGAS